MPEQRSTERIGSWAATALGVVGLVYGLVTALGVAQAGLTEPIVDPVLAIMELLTLVAAPLVVIVLAAVHAWAPGGRATLSLAALSFGTVMAGLTSAVHFVGLSAGRQLGGFVLQWPSVPYAVELLAWDVFLGLALIFAAPVFSGPGRPSTVRRAFAATGFLCLVGAVGPLLGDMGLQRVGVVGYGVGLPISSFLLAGLFRESSKAAE